VLADIVTILGCVAVLEGLVLALAPSRFEDLVNWLSRLDIFARRQIGLVIVATGVILVWVAKYFLS
jgi:uncharacterized protein YjeT (DUF2065 family)